MNISSPEGRRIWRVGYAPDPWIWTDWKWAQGNHFEGRWDDVGGSFRMLYAGGSLEGCLVELLAPLRPDNQLSVELASINCRQDDLDRYPTLRAGEIDISWLESRIAGTANISGKFCDMTSATTIAGLWPLFKSKVAEIGFKDLDVAALNSAQSRPLTQQVSAHLYANTDLDGIVYSSRHGTDLTLWAIYERIPKLPPQCLSDQHSFELSPADPVLLKVFNMLGLKWLRPVAGMPLPIVEVSAEEVWNEVFPNGDPGPTDPLRAAMLWIEAIEDPVKNRPALDILTVNTKVWNFREVSVLMDELSIATKVINSSDPNIKHVKFFPYAGEEAARATETAPLESVHVLTLCWPAGAQCWQVWGLSHNWVPQPSDVYAPNP